MENDDLKLSPEEAEEARAAYDAATPAPLSSDRVAEIVKFATRGEEDIGDRICLDCGKIDSHEKDCPQVAIPAPPPMKLPSWDELNKTPTLSVKKLEEDLRANRCRGDFMLAVDSRVYVESHVVLKLIDRLHGAERVARSYELQATQKADLQTKTTLAPERCRHNDCGAMVERRDGNRCGGILFGTNDQMEHSCGGFFCDSHLLSRMGPFRCPACHAARKRAAERG